MVLFYLLNRTFVSVLCYQLKYLSCFHSIMVSSIGSVVFSVSVFTLQFLEECSENKCCLLTFKQVTQFTVQSF